jgi:hypothetical protein
LLRTCFIQIPRADDRADPDRNRGVFSGSTT